MQIQLVETKVYSLVICDQEEDKPLTGLKVGTAFHPAELEQFTIVFDLQVATSDNERVFDIKFVAFFKSDKEITEADRELHFFNVNAPAIAYPFLRSYVANVMLLSGYEPVMLSTINFSQLAKDIAAENEVKEIQDNSGMIEKPEDRN
ncbi:MAG: protein-export chaperone SecB [Candidatus Sedimenticola sp. (ex Thyasira tokunagai)]